MRYQVAIDCHFSMRGLRELMPTSVALMYQAPEGEMDSLWVRDAVKRGAKYIVSRDYDIFHEAERHGVQCIWVANKKRKSTAVANFLIKYFKKLEEASA